MLRFDTVLHNPGSLELLLKTVGSARCVFGTVLTLTLNRPHRGNALEMALARALNRGWNLHRNRIAR
ncbi:MAG TPA: hypothetical protein VNO54_09625 [Streptosporangiaceae bacterium]|nr:hypothetical protein [Streptosporangiaceae bacterium]